MSMKTATAEFTVRRLCCGKSCGKYGLPGFERKSDKRCALYGINPEDLVGPLHEGAVIELTVRVIRRGKPRVNPWLRRRKSNE